MFQSAMNGLRLLASLRLTPFGMVLLGGGVLASYRIVEAPQWWIVAPLLLLAVNLLAALAVNPRLQRQTGLLVFHLSLAAVLILAAAGYLLRLQAAVEITVGQAFDADRITIQQEGPWHPQRRLRAVVFEQGDFQVEYAPQLVRGSTVIEVLVPDGAGGSRRVIARDAQPLRINGYRFSSTPNKGYSLMFTWRGADGRAQAGAVNLPSFPLKDWNQLNHWRTPAGTELTVALQLPTPVRDDRHWVLDSRDARGEAILTLGDRSVTLRPGQSVVVAGGSLRYDGPRMWMGYKIQYEPTIPWLLAAALTAVLGLAAHIRARLGARAPDTTNPVLEPGIACETTDASR